MSSDRANSKFFSSNSLNNLYQTLDINSPKKTHYENFQI